MLGNKLLNIQFAKYHIWNNKSLGFPNMVLSTERFNQSVRTEYSEAVNARYTFQPLWVSDEKLSLSLDQTLASMLIFRSLLNITCICLISNNLQKFQNDWFVFCQ